jgi:hypothetical protein
MRRNDGEQHCLLIGVYGRPIAPLKARPKNSARRPAKPRAFHARAQYFLPTPKNPSAAPANMLSSAKTIVAGIGLHLEK